MVPGGVPEPYGRAEGFQLPGLAVRAAGVRQHMADALQRHHAWIREHGVDMPEVTDWTWDG